LILKTSVQPVLILNRQPVLAVERHLLVLVEQPLACFPLLALRLLVRLQHRRQWLAKQF